jgi:hypothetical protein
MWGCNGDVKGHSAYSSGDEITERIKGLGYQMNNLEFESQLEQGTFLSNVQNGWGCTRPPIQWGPGFF